MHIEKTKLVLSISVEAGTKSKVRMTIPLTDLRRAGLEEGSLYKFGVVKPGKIRIYPDPDGTRKVPERLSKSEAVTFNVYGSSFGFPVISCHPIELDTLPIPGAASSSPYRASTISMKGKAIQNIPTTEVIGGMLLACTGVLRLPLFSSLTGTAARHDRLISGS